MQYKILNFNRNYEDEQLWSYLNNLASSKTLKRQNRSLYLVLLIPFEKNLKNSYSFYLAAIQNSKFG